jgi:uncharacterized protein
MKSNHVFYALFVPIAILVSPGCTNQSENHSTKTDTKETSSDEMSDSLRQRLGADDYGMKQYVFAYLKKGPNRNQDDSTARALQTAHMNNMVRMADEGKLVVAGPFMDDTDVRGIYIFNTPSIDSAGAWTNSDPAIKAGRLIMELHPWYGSAALMEVNALHKKLEKSDITAK